MLRSRARADRRKLRTLFKNLSRLRSERQVSLTEVSIPGSVKESTPPERKWISVEEIINAPLGKDESKVRIFQEVSVPETEIPTSKRKTSVIDAVTGMDTIFSSAENLTDEEIFLLRKLTTAMVWAKEPSTKAAAEVLARLRKLEPHPQLLRLLTPYAWKFLWAMETEDIPSSRSRQVGDLMVKAGVDMTEEQEIAYVGGLFWSDSRDRAIKRWEGLVKRIPSLAVWNLGVRIFSLERNPEKAVQVIEKMIKTLGYTEHKTWIPIVMAYNHIHEGKKAWHTYQRMLKCAEKNGERITAKQFDSLAMSFLDNYNPLMGLEVYKHMVFAGHNALDRQQTETYQNLSEAVQAAQQQSVDPESLNALSLDAIKNLPPKVANRYFYSGWMLNLMRMGRTDLAWFLVADVMHSQQFPPDSIHCNWVIQGFLQENKIEQAERIAEEMISERLNQIEMGRKKKASPEEIEKILVAPATIQTFSILMQFYSRRKFMDRISPLYQKMLECDIPSNAYIMNHLLYALFRMRDMLRLADAFEAMVREARVPPDFESFTIMWTAMWRHHTEPHQKSTEFLTPRELWKLTMEHLPKRTEDAEGSMKDIWYAIIKCLLLVRDLEGALLALHAGTTLWCMEIDQTVTQEVAFGVLRARPWDPAVTRGRPRIDAGTVVVSVANVLQLGRDIMQRRGRKRGHVDSAPRRRGLIFDADEGTLESLTSILVREMGMSTLIQDELKRARRDMGLENVRLEGLEAIL
ncbi:hypothetical protein BDD12DRAFT_855284 [Trichophaea hybrida]|nr:hypothetical protein BDD12DRAFT_855284 [Trichophaea hybrida]